MLVTKFPHTNYTDLATMKSCSSNFTSSSATALLRDNQKRTCSLKLLSLLGIVSRFVFTNSGEGVDAFVPTSQFNAIKPFHYREKRDRVTTERIEWYVTKTFCFSF